MQFVITKTSCFTRLLKAGDKIREFNFLQLGSMPKDLYEIDVVDDRGIRTMFRMSNKSGAWKIIIRKNSRLTIPDWVLSVEEDLRYILDSETHAAAPQDDGMGYPPIVNLHDTTDTETEYQYFS